jgi:hypothetical protein
MENPSLTAMFHKDGHDDEKSTLFNNKSQTLEEVERYKEKRGELKEVEKIVSETVKLVKGAKLDEDYLNDDEQRLLLDKTKEATLNKILEVFKDIKEYMLAVRTLDEAKKRRDTTGEEWRVDNAEKVRTKKHNALMSDFQSTIRLISFNFAQLSEKAIENWEEEREEKGLPVLKAKRMKFPPKILCPEYIDIRDRKQISQWAIKVFVVSLEKAKKDFPKI